IGGNADTCYTIFMATEAEQFDAGGRVPQPDRAVLPPAREPATVGGKGHAVYAGVVAQAAELGARGHLPQPYRVVVRSAGEPATIGRKGYAGDAALVAA